MLFVEDFYMRIAHESVFLSIIQQDYVEYNANLLKSCGGCIIIVIKIRTRSNTDIISKRAIYTRIKIKRIYFKISKAKLS